MTCCKDFKNLYLYLYNLYLCLFLTEVPLVVANSLLFYCESSTDLLKTILENSLFLIRYYTFEYVYILSKSIIII